MNEKIPVRVSSALYTPISSANCVNQLDDLIILQKNAIMKLLFWCCCVLESSELMCVSTQKKKEAPKDIANSIHGRKGLYDGDEERPAGRRKLRHGQISFARLGNDFFFREFYSRPLVWRVKCCTRTRRAVETQGSPASVVFIVPIQRKNGSSLNSNRCGSTAIGID